MNARMLLPVFDAIYLAALASWIGSVFFFLFGVAPVLREALDPKSAPRFARVFYPRFYTWGATAGAIALPALLGGPLSFPNELRGPLVGIQAFLILAAALMMLYGGNSLTPALFRAFDAGAAGETQVEVLHKRGLWVNGVVAGIGFVLIVCFVIRPTPRTTGLQDLPPEQRAKNSLDSFLKQQAEYNAESAKRQRAPSGEE